MENSAMTTTRLGWVGLGAMGLSMAANLQRFLQKTPSAPSLIYYNRTASRGDALWALGASSRSSPAEIVRDADITFLALSDDASLDTIVDGIILSVGDSLSGKIIANTTTVSPGAAARAASRLAERGAVFVSSPVMGSSAVAARGQVIFMLSGPEHATEAVERYVVGIMGKACMKLGEDVKKGALMKVTGNLLGFAMMEAVCEAHVFAEKSGLGSEVLESFIELQFGPAMSMTSQRMSGGSYIPPDGQEPLSKLDLAIKDMGIVLDCGKEAGVKLDICETGQRHLEGARKYAEEKGLVIDSHSMYGAARKEAGLDFEVDAIKNRKA